MRDYPNTIYSRFWMNAQKCWLINCWFRWCVTLQEWDGGNTRMGCHLVWICLHFNLQTAWCCAARGGSWQQPRVMHQTTPHTHTYTRVHTYTHMHTPSLIWYHRCQGECHSQQEMSHKGDADLPLPQTKLTRNSTWWLCAVRSDIKSISILKVTS